MKTFVSATALVFGLFTMQAIAADPEPATTTDDAATEQTAEEIDCSTLEGDAKTECEAKKAAAEADTTEEPAAEEPAKGGKAKRSNTNRLESEMTDE